MNQKHVFYFYVTAAGPQRGQSNHLAVICVQVLEFPEPFYKIGVAVKHPKDRLPFKCSEGRAIAHERATLAKRAYGSLQEARDEIKRIVRPFEQEQLLVNDALETASRVIYVLALHLDK